MGKIYGGHLAAKYLKAVKNVTTVFTISGGHIENLLDGFTEYGIRTIDVRHEQAAAMMAHAWSVYTGEPGVCLVTAGPGFTNALTGIANASLDNVPLVVLCGRHPIRDELTGALQEFNQVDMVKPAVKWTATCYETRRIPEYLDTAFRQAAAGRPGPVFLELPPDILFVEEDDQHIAFPGPGHRKYHVLPAEDALQAAAELINRAERPVFLGGSGVGFSGCKDALEAFFGSAAMPFALLNNGRGTLPDDHSQCINDCALTAVLSALPQADVIVAAGIRFNWLLQSGRHFPDAKVVRMDIDPAEIDRNRAADVGLAGDCKDVLERLNPLLKKRDHTEWTTRLKNACSGFMATELEKRVQPSDPIHPIRLVSKIQEFFGTDAHYVADGGDTTYYALAGFLSRHRGGVIAQASGLFGCLGTGIPFAMTAKLLHPDKPAVVFSGDGSFGFNSMEFDTAVRHNIPIICVVNNDCAWGMIKHAQEISLGADRCTCSELGMRNYHQMVEGLGGHGELVTADDEIIPALQRAVESGKPACINVVTDPTVTSPATILFYQSFTGFGE